MSVSVEDGEDRHRDIGAAEEDIRDLLRSFADWIYKQLETEYNYLMSNEQIDESLEINGYEFNAEGRPV